MSKVSFILARIGLHGSQENSDTLSERELKEMVRNFEPNKAPLVLGHDIKEDSPALGYINSLNFNKTSGELKGEATFNSPKIKEVVKKYFNNWSIGVRKLAKDGTSYLHHLAFLGGVQGKVKGLGKLEEALKDARIFSEEQIKNIKVKLNFSEDIKEVSVDKEKEEILREVLKKELIKEIKRDFSEDLKKEKERAKALEEELNKSKEEKFKANLKAFSEEFSLVKEQNEALEKVLLEQSKDFSQNDGVFENLRKVFKPFKEAKEFFNNSLTTNFSEGSNSAEKNLDDFNEEDIK